MAQEDVVFAGSIPELYDRYLGSLIFQPYARVVAAQVTDCLKQPGQVLETAAGTGILTSRLVRALPPGSPLTATDLNQPMLDFAAARVGAGNVYWRQADALSLPFDANHFEVVVCQFGAMFFPDKVAGYREAWRVLRPGGHLVLAIWDNIADNEFADVLTEAVAALFPVDPPRFLARTPHGYCDRGVIRSHLESAGFADIRIDTMAERSRAASPQEPAIGFCQGTPLRSEIEARGPGRLAEVTEIAAAALAERFGAGAIDGKIQAHIVAARA